MVPDVLCGVDATETVVPLTLTLALHATPPLPQVNGDGMVVVLSVSANPGYVPSERVVTIWKVSCSPLLTLLLGVEPGSDEPVICFVMPVTPRRLTRALRTSWSVLVA